jgi:hypothetical protein
MKTVCFFIFLSHYPSNSSKMVHDIDQPDAVEHESVQKVSRARAMFENLSTTKSPVESHPQEQAKTRPKLKTW